MCKEAIVLAGWRGFNGAKECMWCLERWDLRSAGVHFGPLERSGPTSPEQWHIVRRAVGICADTHRMLSKLPWYEEPLLLIFPSLESLCRISWSLDVNVLSICGLPEEVSYLAVCSCGLLCAGRRWVMELTGSKLIQQEETRGENWFLSITVSQSGSCRGCVGLMLAWRKEPTFTPATCTATSLNLMQTCSVAKTQQMNFGIFFSVTAERLLIYPHIMTSSLIRRKVSNETMCTKWTASYRSKLTGEFFHECSLCDISIV